MLKNIGKRIGLLALAGVLLTGNSVCAADAEDEKITLRIMHYWGDTDADISARYLKEILENEFEEAFPNVELVQEIYDNETYKSKIKVCMAADEVPDIVFGYGAGFSETFVKAGKILALDDYLDDFYKEHMLMDMQENFIYDGKLYGICLSYWTGVLYCNMALFEEIDAEIPETYEELIEVCERFRDADIQPIACGILDKWQAQQFINNYTIQLGGAELYNAIARGEESFDNEILAEAADFTANLVEKGVFQEDMYQLASNEAEEGFLNGNAAMIYIGSWFTSFAEERLGENLEVAKMPVVSSVVESADSVNDSGNNNSDNASNDSDINSAGVVSHINDYHGGGINGWMVSADTEYPELAADIVAWLGYRLSCYQPENATFIIEEGDEMAEISETSQEILDLYKDKANGGVAWDTLMRSDKADIWLDACTQLFEGKLDGQEFVKVLDSQMK